jgi:hypothetical protein
VKSAIHSGSARTLLASEDTDLYPLALTRNALRPGAVFADPYGHTLMLVRWIPQSENKPGILMAVDAQPDGTVTIKRFWRGNFLFTQKKIIGEAGFKAFRPARNRKGIVKPLSNNRITSMQDYGNYSLIQMSITSIDFYDRMDLVINPEPLNPDAAFRQLHEALHEQILTRLTALANGEEWVSTNPGKTIKMPSGIRIFQTSGPWEDFSTPARDLRLLIAIDAVRDFPDKVVRMPDAFDIPQDITPEQMRMRLLATHKQWAREYAFQYRRSDSAGQDLTMQDVISRSQALEMAYNPNDCPELRWGAPPDSEEARSCRRRAPKQQVNKMKKYRKWFISRVRPAWN